MTCPFADCTYESYNNVDPSDGLSESIDLLEHLINEHNDFENIMGGADRSDFIHTQQHARQQRGSRAVKATKQSSSSLTPDKLKKLIVQQTVTPDGAICYVCPVTKPKVCGKVFNERGNAIVHIRIHTGERPYACKFPGCGKTFTTIGNKNDHYRRHTKDKPYVCSFCGVRYYRKY